MDTALHETNGDETNGDGAEVVVYWRPGCGFCSSLRRALAHAGVPTREINIWDEPDGAALVRQATGGSETVPTVSVAGQTLVNPAPTVVVALAERAGIEATPPERTGILSRFRRV